MASAKNSNARVTRWFLALQDFRFQVDHMPGREHANAALINQKQPEASSNGGGVWQPGPNTSGQEAQRKGGGGHLQLISTSRHQRAIMRT